MTALNAQIIDDGSSIVRPAFLAVEKSAKGLRWIDRLGVEFEQTAIALAQEHNIPEILARMLAGRGCTPGSADDHLYPRRR